MIHIKTVQTQLTVRVDDDRKRPEKEDMVARFHGIGLPLDDLLQVVDERDKEVYKVRCCDVRDMRIEEVA